MAIFENLKNATTLYQKNGRLIFPFLFPGFRHRRTVYWVQVLKTGTSLPLFWVGLTLVPAGASRTMIGNYERNINAPSIEVIANIAKVLEVSVDFLIGKGTLASLDKDVLKRIEDIQMLDDETQSKLFFLIDNVVQNFKTKQAFSK